MTDKEFHKLKRQDVLRLLLAQVKEAEELRSKLAETEGRLIVAEGSYERLRKRLDTKDAQINKLKGRLDKKDDQIRNLKTALDKFREEKLYEATEPGSIAEAALQLSGIFEAAQNAAELYLRNVKRLSEEASEAEE